MAVATHATLLCVDHSRFGIVERFQWHAHRLGKTIASRKLCKVQDGLATLQILPTPSYTTDTRTVNLATKVSVVYAKYKVVLAVDASPSMFALDTGTARIPFDDVGEALEDVLTALTRPLPTAPEDGATFDPEIYVSLIAGGGSSPPHLLVHNALLHHDNLDTLLVTLRDGLAVLETQRAQEARLPPAPPLDDGQSLLTMGRQVLSLLPADAAPLLLLFTDGILNVAAKIEYEADAMKLRRDGITVHVCHLGHATLNAGFGLVVFPQAVNMLASATGGTTLYVSALTEQLAPPARQSPRVFGAMWPPLVAHMLIYHSLLAKNPPPRLPTTLHPTSNRKQVREYWIRADPRSLVCCRLREGFIVQDASFKPTAPATVSLWLRLGVGVIVHYHITVPYKPRAAAVPGRLARPRKVHIGIDVNSVGPSGDAPHVTEMLKELQGVDKVLAHLCGVPTLFRSRASAKADKDAFFASVGSLPLEMWKRWFVVRQFEVILNDGLHVEPPTPASTPTAALLHQAMTKQRGATTATVAAALDAWADVSLRASLFVKLLPTAAAAQFTNAPPTAAPPAMPPTAADPPAPGTAPHSPMGPQATPFAMVRLHTSGDNVLGLQVAMFCTPPNRRTRLVANLRTVLQSCGVRLLRTAPILHQMLLDAPSPLPAATLPVSFLWRRTWEWTFKTSEAATVALSLLTTSRLRSGHTAVGSSSLDPSVPMHLMRVLPLNLGPAGHTGASGLGVKRRVTRAVWATPDAVVKQSMLVVQSLVMTSPTVVRVTMSAEPCDGFVTVNAAWWESLKEQPVEASTGSAAEDPAPTKPPPRLRPPEAAPVVLVPAKHWYRLMCRRQHADDFSLAAAAHSFCEALVAHLLLEEDRAPRPVEPPPTRPPLAHASVAVMDSTSSLYPHAWTFDSSSDVLSTAPSGDLGAAPFFRVQPLISGMVTPPLPVPFTLDRLLTCAHRDELRLRAVRGLVPVPDGCTFGDPARYHGQRREMPTSVLDGPRSWNTVLMRLVSRAIAVLADHTAPHPSRSASLACTQACTLWFIHRVAEDAVLVVSCCRESHSVREASSASPFFPVMLYAVERSEVISHALKGTGGAMLETFTAIVSGASPGLPSPAAVVPFVGAQSPSGAQSPPGEKSGFLTSLHWLHHRNFTRAVYVGLCQLGPRPSFTLCPSDVDLAIDQCVEFGVSVDLSPLFEILKAGDDAMRAHLDTQFADILIRWLTPVPNTEYYLCDPQPLHPGQPHVPGGLSHDGILSLTRFGAEFGGFEEHTPLSADEPPPGVGAIPHPLFVRLEVRCIQAELAQHASVHPDACSHPKRGPAASAAAAAAAAAAVAATSAPPSPAPTDTDADADSDGDALTAPSSLPPGSMCGSDVEDADDVGGDDGGVDRHADACSAVPLEGSLFDVLSASTDNVALRVVCASLPRLLARVRADDPTRTELLALPAVLPREYGVHMRGLVQELQGLFASTILTSMHSQGLQDGAHAVHQLDHLQDLLALVPPTHVSTSRHVLEFVAPVSKALPTFQRHLLASMEVSFRAHGDWLVVESTAVDDVRDTIQYWMLAQVSDKELRVTLHHPPNSYAEPRRGELMGAVDAAVQASLTYTNTYHLLVQLDTGRLASPLLIPAGEGDPEPAPLPPASSFTAGQFGCPMQCELWVALHKRLGNADVCKNLANKALNMFSIDNRLNTFVYGGHAAGGKYYYLRLSVEARPADMGPLEEWLVSTSPLAPVEDSADATQCVVVRIHGMETPDPGMIKGLRGRLVKYLAGLTLAMLSTLISKRNRHSRLAPGDVAFIKGDKYAPDAMAAWVLPGCMEHPHVFLQFLQRRFGRFLYALNIEDGGEEGDGEERKDDGGGSGAESVGFVFNPTVPIRQDAGLNTLSKAVGDGLAFVFVTLFPRLPPAFGDDEGDTGSVPGVHVDVRDPTGWVLQAVGRPAVQAMCRDLHDVTVGRLSPAALEAVGGAGAGREWVLLTRVWCKTALDTMNIRPLLHRLKRAVQQATIEYALEANLLVLDGGTSATAPSTTVPTPRSPDGGAFVVVAPPVGGEPPPSLPALPPTRADATEVFLPTSHIRKAARGFTVASALGLPSVYTVAFEEPIPPSMTARLVTELRRTVRNHAPLCRPVQCGHFVLGGVVSGHHGGLHPDVVAGAARLESVSAAGEGVLLSVTPAGVRGWLYRLRADTVQAIQARIAVVLTWVRLRSHMLASIVAHKAGAPHTVPLTCASVARPATSLSSQPSSSRHHLDMVRTRGLHGGRQAALRHRGRARHARSRALESLEVVTTEQLEALIGSRAPPATRRPQDARASESRPALDARTVARMRASGRAPPLPSPNPAPDRAPSQTSVLLQFAPKGGTLHLSESLIVAVSTMLNVPRLADVSRDVPDASYNAVRMHGLQLRAAARVLKQWKDERLKVAFVALAPAVPLTEEAEVAPGPAPGASPAMRVSVDDCRDVVRQCRLVAAYRIPFMPVVGEAAGDGVIVDTFLVHYAQHLVKALGPGASVIAVAGVGAVVEPPPPPDIGGPPSPRQPPAPRPVRTVYLKRVIVDLMVIVEAHVTAELASCQFYVTELRSVAADSVDHAYTNPLYVPRTAPQGRKKAKPKGAKAAPNGLLAMTTLPQNVTALHHTLRTNAFVYDFHLQLLVDFLAALGASEDDASLPRRRRQVLLPPASLVAYHHLAHHIPATPEQSALHPLRCFLRRYTTPPLGANYQLLQGSVRLPGPPAGVSPKLHLSAVDYAARSLSFVCVPKLYSLNTLGDATVLFALSSTGHFVADADLGSVLYAVLCTPSTSPSGVCRDVDAGVTVDVMLLVSGEVAHHRARMEEFQRKALANAAAQEALSRIMMSNKVTRTEVKERRRALLAARTVDQQVAGAGRPAGAGLDALLSSKEAEAAEKGADAKTAKSTVVSSLQEEDLKRARRTRHLRDHRRRDAKAAKQAARRMKQASEAASKAGAPKVMVLEDSKVLANAVQYAQMALERAAARCQRDRLWHLLRTTPQAPVEASTPVRRVGSPDGGGAGAGEAARPHADTLTSVSSAEEKGGDDWAALLLMAVGEEDVPSGDRPPPSTLKRSHSTAAQHVAPPRGKPSSWTLRPQQRSVLSVADLRHLLALCTRQTLQSVDHKLADLSGLDAPWCLLVEHLVMVYGSRIRAVHNGPWVNLFVLPEGSRDAIGHVVVHHPGFEGVDLLGQGSAAIPSGGDASVQFWLMSRDRRDVLSLRERRFFNGLVNHITHWVYRNLWPPV